MKKINMSLEIIVEAENEEKVKEKMLHQLFYIAKYDTFSKDDD